MRRTLDAIELRGAKLMRADQTREGDTICFLNTRFDYSVEGMDVSPTGTPRHHFRDGTGSNAYEPGEMLYVIRGITRHPLYQAALDADAAFAAELVRVYGASRAGDMRYQSSKWLNEPELVALAFAKQQAD